MSRPFARLKLGYYPLPTEEGAQYPFHAGCFRPVLCDRSVRRRERFSHELTLAFENGRILELKETKTDGRYAFPEEATQLEHASAM